ncbi:heterokaryon incompatibility protein-domain-containing protein [Rhexocercosporidium sp. MPI-PUGE-AT-0058]|nr:heterokaryon incompatibility protein-domain-containing protein [Rhexocercosporidium sp. MPI-PUGE-AT-0058]
MCEQLDDSSLGHLQRSFKYTPLNSARNEIRLLRILPHHNDHEPATINCEIIHTSLDTPTSHKALSYAWGSPQDLQYTIKLGGLDMLVRENLWLVLQQLQSSPDPKLLLWVDAVCINQTDTTERNEQVSKMKTIYERADEVIVWLGPSFDNSHLAFELVRELYAHSDDVSWIQLRLRHAHASECLAAFSSLLRRDYWSRMWIVQELAVAKRTLIKCGVDSIDARAMSEVQRLLTSISRREGGYDEDHIMLLLPNDARARAAVQFRGMTEVREVQEVLRSRLRQVSFFECMLHNSLKEATDPRDMVYGLAGLANMNDIYRIEVDYSLGVDDLYIDLAKKELQTCKVLNILTRARLGLNPHHLPSWVPDWSANSDNHKYLYDIKVPEHAYNASGKGRCDIAFTDSRHVLKVTAVVLGHVEVLGEASAMENEDDFQNTCRLFLAWWSLAKGGGDLEFFEGFGRALICSRVSDRNRGLWNKEEFGSFILGAWVDLCRSDSSNNIDPMLAELYSRILVRDKELEEGAGREYKEHERRDVFRRWTQTSANFIWDRRFFLGLSGMMGLATQGVRVRDIICVPLGCPHPMIFTPVDGHYIVVGEAFVDGYMYGKAMGELETMQLKLETFELH